jgi:thiol-disulfide isomerase/thioredoxin
MVRGTAKIARRSVARRSVARRSLARRSVVRRQKLQRSRKITRGNKRIYGGNKDKKVVVKSFPTKKKEPTQKENLEDEIGKCDLNMIKFYMNGCPHCDNIKDIWKSLGEDKDNALEKFCIENNCTLGVYEVNVKDYSPIQDKYGANNGVPHIILVNKDGTVMKTFNGERTKENFIDFIIKSKSNV